MANPEHLKILKQGVDAWNRWRDAHPDTYPDLENAALGDMDLRKCDLHRTDLSHADLCNANLSGASLGSARLSNAILLNTNLEHASFFGTNLREANLQGAHFVESIMGYTKLVAVDLDGAENLESVKHMFPSHVDTETLERTARSLFWDSDRRVAIESFLGGAGVPEHLLEHYRSHYNHPTQFYSCFISYSHDDKSFAHRLHDHLQARGIRCWLDEHQLLPGDDIYDMVDCGIRLWDKVLLCCSEASLTSWWVNDEIDKALEKEQKLLKERDEKILTIIPLILDGYLFEWQDGRAATLRKRLAADFTGWERDDPKFEGQFVRVVKALRTEGVREKPPESNL